MGPKCPSSAGGDHSRKGHGGPVGPGRRHGNPADLATYLARLEGADWAAWQQPDRVVRALALRAGATACDVGAGPGYFALRLARAVGPRGAVYAIDVERRMTEVLRERLQRSGIDNVHAMLSRGVRGSLPPRTCDVVLIVNTFHHFPDGVGYLKRLARRLGPGGRIVVIDFHKRRLPVGPPPAHRVSRAALLAAARGAGLSLVREHRFLRYQYFLELAPNPGPERSRAASRTRAEARGAARGGRPRASDAGVAPER